MRYVTKTRPVNAIDQLFDSMYYGAPAVNRTYSSFPVDILEDQDKYTVKAELAGFNDSEVDITLNDNLLVISAAKQKQAEKAEGEEEKNEVKYLLKERVERQYKRTFSLPKDADRESIKASLKEGLLNLEISKKPETKPVSIKIN